MTLKVPIAPSCGGSGSLSNTWFLGSPRVHPQTTARSVKPFLQSWRSWLTDTQTINAIYNEHGFSGFRCNSEKTINFGDNAVCRWHESVESPTWSYKRFEAVSVRRPSKLSLYHVILRRIQSMKLFLTISGTKCSYRLLWLIRCQAGFFIGVLNIINKTVK